jgi:sugar lactone lactonase YvrE
MKATVVASLADLKTYPFAESMAPYPGGGFVVSVTTCNAACTHDYGRLWLVRTDGTRRAFGPRFGIPTGILTGVVVDERGRVYVGYDTGSQNPMPGVMRVSPDGAVTRMMTLPAGSFPNGLTLVGGRLYVSDSANGAIWVGSTTHPTTPAKPWFTSPLLMPGTDPNLPAIGANGVAIRDGSLYVASWTKGLILRVRITQAGKVGFASVLARGPRLVEADGITFDSAGRLWVTVNNGNGALLLIGPNGWVRSVALPKGTLDYPTQADVRGQDVFVLNGSYFNGTPNLVRLTS